MLSLNRDRDIGSRVSGSDIQTDTYFDSCVCRLCIVSLNIVCDVVSVERFNSPDMSASPSLEMLSPDPPEARVLGSVCVDEYGAQQGVYEQKLRLLDIRAAENAERVSKSTHQVGILKCLVFGPVQPC